MAKKETNTAVKMDGKAFSVVEKDDKWEVVEVPFNKETLEAGQGKIVYSTEYMLDAEERLRILLATDVFL